MSKADEILDIAQEMIQLRGYNAFSFQDISTRLGIKKASVQFYFPKKVDLGRKVVARYAANFKALMQNLDDNPDLSTMAKFDAYIEPFYLVSSGGDLVCLCGVLGGEYGSLPEAVQQEVAAFFKLHEDWLTRFLQAAQASGDMGFEEEPRAMAKTIFSSFQGALIIARSQQSSEHFLQVKDVIRAGLKPRE